MARPLRVGHPATRGIGSFQRLFDAKNDGLGGEQAFLHPHGFDKGGFAGVGRDRHEAQQGAPIHHAGSGQGAGMSIAHPQLIGTDQHVTGFVEPAASGASEHLQDLITPQRNLAALPLVLRRGDSHRTQAEVDAGSQPHGGHHDPELARLGEGFDDSGAHCVAQTTVVIGHSGF